MKEWQEEQKALNEEISRVCRQPFLDKVIGPPSVNPLRTAALMLAFTDEDRKQARVQKQIAAAVLIQLAMDTHDLIPSVTEEMTQEHQLIVLAGDFFSGMYYRTLAEAGSIHWVEILADAVKKVNEAKTSLHRHQLHSKEAVFGAVQTIEGDIIGAVYKENKADKTVWHAIQQLLAADRLLQEKEKPFIAFDALARVLGTNEQAAGALKHQLEQIRLTINTCIQNMDERSASVVRAERDRLFSVPLRFVEEG
ncbi:heptaprenyl diphosphate synthase component 1 [Domibacillus indicus]|uniref:heptaprenyl diphosphate synthase component 1 n=1 Tax=Domibacillus indicus TaxID=1437523 RepID=UPI0006183102|nr:heptaprenyl diphosphate synthase component 1 [Domibacillus indicus]